MRLQELRSQKFPRQREFAAAIGTDEPTVSKFENYKVLPIPRTTRRICEVLECEVSDIYEDAEIYIKPRIKSAAGGEKERYYKLTVRLRKADKALLDKLPDTYYRSITNWINRCVERLGRELAAIEKGEKNVHSNSLER